MQTRERNRFRGGWFAAGLGVAVVGLVLAVASSGEPVRNTAVAQEAATVDTGESAREATDAQRSRGIREADMRILKASRMIGMSVRNHDGESLGRIEELAIDRRHGEIAYAVLAYGGGLFGNGGKYFAIPWEGLRLEAADNALVLDVDRERLERADGMRWEGDWPLEPDPLFAAVGDRGRERAGDTGDSRVRYHERDDVPVVIVPAETRIPVELDQRLASDEAVIGQQFTMTVHEPVRVADRLAVPRGAEIVGTVVAAQEAERPNKPGMLELEPDLLVVDGREIPLRARITIEGEPVEGDESIEEDLREIGIGAAVGAVLGGIIKGGKGALAGLIIGGAGTFLATKGEQVELPVGTPLIIELQRDLEVPITSER